MNVDLPDFGRKVINAVHEQLENASKIDDFLVIWEGERAGDWCECAGVV